MVKERKPANSGNIVYCPHCGEKLEHHLNKKNEDTMMKYCFDCGRGFFQSKGRIIIYRMTKTIVKAAEFKELEVDFP